MYGQVYRAWPCFHQNRIRNSNGRKVHLTNVWASPLFIVMILSQTRGTFHQTKGPHPCTDKSIVHVRASITNESGDQQNKCSHQCTSESIVHDHAFITHKREAQIDESSSSMYGKVHCAWPFFHHKLEGSSTKRNVLFNVRVSPSRMTVLSSHTKGKLKQAKVHHPRTVKAIVHDRAFITHERELKQTKVHHPCTGKSIVHGLSSITNEREAQQNEMSSPIYG